MRTPPVREESQELPEDPSQWVGLGRSLPVPAPYFSRFSWLGPLASLFLMMLALPFIVGLVILTKLTSRGPGIYRQTRVGFGGDVFTVYKIRTMSNDAEASSGPVWTSGISDPRVTALGKFMRASHLDELPQLFNVLKGEMSLIGPRPERPEFTQFLAREIPGYVGRLSVKPGITGLAQIILPPDSDLESVRKKLELDVKYVDLSGFLLDLKITICTAMKMLGFRSADVANWVGLSSCLEESSSGAQKRKRAGGLFFGGRQQGAENSEVEQTRSGQSVSLDELVEKSAATTKGSKLEVSERCSQASGVEALVAEDAADRDTRVSGANDPESGSVDRLPTT